MRPQAVKALINESLRCSDACIICTDHFCKFSIQYDSALLYWLAIGVQQSDFYPPRWLDTIAA